MGTDRPNTSPAVSPQDILMRAEQRADLLPKWKRTFVRALPSAVLGVGASLLWPKASPLVQALCGVGAASLGWVIVALLQNSYWKRHALIDILTERATNANTDRNSMAAELAAASAREAAHWRRFADNVPRVLSVAIAEEPLQPGCFELLVVTKVSDGPLGVGSWHVQLLTSAGALATYDGIDINHSLVGGHYELTARFKYGGPIADASALEAVRLVSLRGVDSNERSVAYVPTQPQLLEKKWPDFVTLDEQKQNVRALYIESLKKNRDKRALEAARDKADAALAQLTLAGTDSIDERVVFLKAMSQTATGSLAALPGGTHGESKIVLPEGGLFRVTARDPLFVAAPRLECQAFFLEDQTPGEAGPMLAAIRFAIANDAAPHTITDVRVQHTTGVPPLRLAPRPEYEREILASELPRTLAAHEHWEIAYSSGELWAEMIAADLLAENAVTTDYLVWGRIRYDDARGNRWVYGFCRSWRRGAAEWLEFGGSAYNYTRADV